MGKEWGYRSQLKIKLLTRVADTTCEHLACDSHNSHCFILLTMQFKTQNGKTKVTSIKCLAPSLCRYKTKSHVSLIS